MDGMNESNAKYSYSAVCSTNLDYSVATAPFVSAIHQAVGTEPILGGNDKKVKEACDACYEELKAKHTIKKGYVEIFKNRHPDGKTKRIKKYKF